MGNTIKIIKAIISEWAKDHQQDCNEVGLHVAKKLLEDNPLYRKPQAGAEKAEPDDGKYNKKVTVLFNDQTGDNDTKLAEGTDIDEAASVLMCSTVFLLSKKNNLPPYDVELALAADLMKNALKHKEQFGALFEMLKKRE